MHHHGDYEFGWNMDMSKNIRCEASKNQSVNQKCYILFNKRYTKGCRENPGFPECIPTYWTIKGLNKGKYRVIVGVHDEENDSYI